MMSREKEGEGDGGRERERLKERVERDQIGKMKSVRK